MTKLRDYEIALFVTGGVMCLIGLTVPTPVLRQLIKHIPWAQAGVGAMAVTVGVIYFKQDYERSLQQFSEKTTPEVPTMPPSTRSIPQTGRQEYLSSSQSGGSSPVTVTATPQQWDDDIPFEEDVTPGVANQWDADADLDMERLRELLNYPSVLIFGPPGSGKSTLAEWLIYERIKLGHKVEVLDLHRKYGQWEGLEVYGDGLDYDACDRRLVAFIHLVKSRYQQRAKNPEFNPRPFTVLVEEFTQWHRKCEHSAEFFECSISDIRKVACHVVFVSHARTLIGLGGAKGFAETRDSALLEVELMAQVDPNTGEATPTGRGFIYYPGRKSNPVEVTIPRLDRHPLQPVNHPPTHTPPHDLRYQLEWLVNDSPVPPLAPDAQAIHQWALRQGKPVTSRQVQQARLRPLDGYSAQQIRDLFVLLGQVGKGQIQGVGAEMTYHANT